MSVIKTGNKTHDDTCLAAEAARQVAVAGANRAAVIAAEISFYRTCLASALANGCGVEPSIRALQALGIGGV
jgi:hypothetical protein